MFRAALQMLGIDHFKYSSKVTRFEHWANEQLQKRETEHVNGLFFSFTLSNQSTPSNLLTVTNCLPQAHLQNSSWTKKKPKHQLILAIHGYEGRFRPTQNEKNQQFKTKIKESALITKLLQKGLNLKEENKMLRVT